VRAEKNHLSLEVLYVTNLPPQIYVIAVLTLSLELVSDIISQYYQYYSNKTEFSVKMCFVFSENYLK